MEIATATGYTGDELGMAGYLALGGADLLGQLQNRDFAAMGETAVTMGGRLITEGMKKAAIGTIDAIYSALLLRERLIRYLVKHLILS